MDYAERTASPRDSAEDVGLPPAEIGCLSMMEWLITNSLLTAVTVEYICLVGYTQEFCFIDISIMNIVLEVDGDLKSCAVLPSFQ